MPLSISYLTSQTNSVDEKKTPTDLQQGDQWGPGRANLGGDLTSRKKRK
jgi:hypothetical protein